MVADQHNFAGLGPWTDASDVKYRTVTVLCGHCRGTVQVRVDRTAQTLRCPLCRREIDAATGRVTHADED